MQVFTLLIVMAALLLTVELAGLYTSPTCPDCGGKREHGKDCWRGRE